MINWIKPENRLWRDDELALCAFWGGWGDTYTYALGTWDESESKFQFGWVAPKGALLWCCPIQGPQRPAPEDDWQKDYDGKMSSWPVVGIECYRCDNYLTVFHLDFDVCHTDEEQATFVKILTFLGWDTHGLPDTEVNDDGMWTRLCPNCKAVEMIRRLYEIDGEPT